VSEISVIIPNYNGRGLLSRYLPDIQKTLGDSCDLVVVDDGSTDDSLDFLDKQFPDVRVIAREKNGGFSKAVNDGIKSVTGDFILLLNNDVEVMPGLLDRILPLFDDNDVFAVGPSIILPKFNNLDEGAKTGRWYHGMFYPDQRQGITDVITSLYTTGCAAVYRRSMLDALGGFDDAYSPFYWEDSDLGYRAWKRGWKSLYQPSAIVYHQHSASISSIRKKITSRIMARNSLFFIWRNMEDQQIIKNHRLWLPSVILRRLAVGDISFMEGWHDAYIRRHEAISARSADSQNRKLSDKEIFRIIGIETP
jgi:GT2 family glycosyltransferase